MSIYDHPLMEKQIELEEEMLIQGRNEFYKRIERYREKGEEADTPYGKYLIKKMIIPFSEAITSFINQAKKKPGVRHFAIKYMEKFDPDLLAFVTLKIVLDSISYPQTLQSVATSVGTALENEDMMNRLQDHDKDKHNLVKVHLERKYQNNRQRRRMVSRIISRRHGVSPDWPMSDKLHLGIKLIELLIQTAGMVAIETSYGKGSGPDTPKGLVATPIALDWIDKLNERMEFLSPSLYPTVIPPKRWTTPFNGGYWAGMIPRWSILKTRNPAILEEFKNADMKRVYASVNAMQETPWRVNKRVVTTLTEAWEGGPGMCQRLKLPPRDNLLPPTAEGIDFDNPDEKRKWKKAASKVHEANAKNSSRRLMLRKIIEIAHKFQDYEEIYFPYQLDFRGRAYAVPLYLNPQGPDAAKGILTFAHGKPIENGVAAGWLAIHGANCYGFDKASLEDRISWVEERNDLILSVDEDPFGPAFEFWSSANSPWQFLAFCFEWAGFLREGYGYVSSLPVALDGSCNGLQHYSAALRDPVGGKAVNLIPSDLPQDIYGEVARVTVDLVNAVLCPNAPGSGIDRLDHLQKMCDDYDMDMQDMARKWLSFGIDRKITKRSVMTLPYGSSQYSCREFIEDAMAEKIGDGKPNPFAIGDDPRLFYASLWLQPLVWQAIGQVVKAAREGMDWLKKCASLVAKEELPVVWVTPDGFIVQQMYSDYTRRRVKTQIHGQTVKLTLLEEIEDKVDKRRQQRGIAPNWVHSMDATAMRMFVSMARSEYGITNFYLVHDSFGTLAADVETMGYCIRKSFHDLYVYNDPLAEFRVDIASMLSDANLAKLPPLPEKGSLDLSLVLESDFFFA